MTTKDSAEGLLREPSEGMMDGAMKDVTERGMFSALSIFKAMSAALLAEKDK